MQQPQPLGFQRGGQIAYPSDVFSRPAKTSDEALFNGIGREGGNDWDRRCRSLGGQSGRFAAGRSKHGHRQVDELRRLRCQPIILSLSPAIFDRHVLALDEAVFGQPSAERGQQMRGLPG
jgi:hypothetical protein